MDYRLLIRGGRTTSPGVLPALLFALGCFMTAEQLKTVRLVAHLLSDGVGLLVSVRGGLEEPARAHVGSIVPRLQVLAGELAALAAAEMQRMAGSDSKPRPTTKGV
jgi:hypothetical protein